MVEVTLTMNSTGIEKAKTRNQLIPEHNHMFEEIIEDINKYFESFEIFEKLFIEKAMGVFNF